MDKRIEDLPAAQEKADNGKVMDANEPSTDKVDTKAEDEVPPVEEVATEEEYDFDDIEDRSVRGWLAFFLWVGIGLGVLITVFQSLEGIKDLTDITDSNIGLYLFTMVAAQATLGIYTIVAFYMKRPDAVACAKAYTLYIIADSVASLLLDGSSEEAQDAIRSIIWGGVWFLFLINSSRVQAVIPKETRKMSPLSIILPLICAISLVLTYKEISNLQKIYIDELNDLDTESVYIENEWDDDHSIDEAEYAEGEAEAADPYEYELPATDPYPATEYTDPEYTEVDY